MGKRLRKTLPKNLDELLKAAGASGDETPVRVALEACLPDARGGYGSGTVLALRCCTPTIARWAVERGTDVHAADTYGRTPLHEVAGRRHHSPLGVDDLLQLGARIDATCASGRTALHYAVDAQNLVAVQVLLSRDADPNALDEDGKTPLEWAMRRMANAYFLPMIPVAQQMLGAGARLTQPIKDYTRKAAENFEFHRDGFNRDMVDEVARAVVALCRLFDVEPPGPHRRHDGVSRIVATAATWQERHAELWDMLVPSKGAAHTVQGEVIRITGRISRELLGNGGGNWDRDSRAMANALVAHLGTGDPLSPEELAEARTAAAQLLADDAGAERLAELAVGWVTRNTNPIPLPPPEYLR